MVQEKRSYPFYNGLTLSTLNLEQSLGVFPDVREFPVGVVEIDFVVQADKLPLRVGSQAFLIDAFRLVVEQAVGISYPCHCSQEHPRKLAI